MVKRKIFTLDVVDTDHFLDLPSSSQALYFHLGMRSDEEGYVASPRKITKMAHCAEDDLKLLLSKGFLLLSGDGIVVVRDMSPNNKVRKAGDGPWE